MSDKKSEPSLADRMRKLEAEQADAWQTIRAMQRTGGFADSKTLSIRSTRIEARVELLELDGEMLKDVAAETNTLLADHLRDRHDVDLDRDSAIDATAWRKIRRRLRDWAEKRGLMSKRRDLTDTRRDEGRLRPRAAS